MTRDQFHDLDYHLMAIAFDIHNQMGRLQNESIYKNELTYLAQQQGIQVQTEAPIKITHKDFSKTFFLDMLVNNEIIYELKSLPALIAQNRNQLLNYLFISNRPHGKLINFGSGSVEHEYITTALNLDTRRQFRIKRDTSEPIRAEVDAFEETLIDLLRNWGTRLDVNLYTEAMTHFLGGELRVLHEIKIQTDNRTLGSKQVHCISDGHAFKITAVSSPKPMRIHLQRFLNYSNLESLHWVNMNGDSIHIEPLSKKSSCH